MKTKSFLLLIAMFCFVAAKANTDFKGTKKNNVSGIVIHSISKKTVKDVSVTAYLFSQKMKVVFTDEKGNFSFDELRPGTYKLIFEKIGFKKNVKENVVIEENEKFQMAIEMIESNEFDIIPSPFHFVM